MQNILLLFTAFFLLVSCGTPEKDLSPPPARPAPKGLQAPKDAVVDLDLLQQKVGLNTDERNLGFFERSFNTCNVGQAYITDKACTDMIFVLIHFRAQCRDSEGTVQSVTNIELMPVGSRRFQWKLGLFKGIAQTDSEGYGQVRLVAPGTSINQPLMIKVGTNNLRLGARNVKRIIVPRDWCY